MTKLQELRKMDQVSQMKALMNMTNKDMVAILKEEKVKGRTKYKNKDMLQDKILEMLFAPEKVEIIEGQVTVEEVIYPEVVEVVPVESEVDLSQDELFQNQCRFVVDQIEEMRNDSISDGFGDFNSEDDISGISIDLSNKLLGKFFTNKDFSIDAKSVEIFCYKLAKVQGLNDLLDVVIEDVIHFIKHGVKSRNNFIKSKDMTPEELENYLNVDPEECPF